MLLATLIAIPLLLIWVLALVDLLRRHDLGAGAKVVWAIAVLVVPVVGVIVYLVARPAQPGDRPATLDPIGDETHEPMRRRHGPA
jgi:phospholipase D-like protein